MNSRFDQDPFQELTQAVRQATPSVDRQILTSEAVTIRAEQIAKELWEDLQQSALPENDVIFRNHERFTQDSVAMMRDGLEKLLNLQQSAQTTVENEKVVKDDIQKITNQISSDLKTFAGTLDRLEQLQRYRQVEDENRRRVVEEVVNTLLKQFDSSEIAFRQIRWEPLRLRDIDKEAQFLAEAQVRRDLLNRQRQNQLKQGRLVFFVALVLLSLGVLVVFAGIIGIYVLNLTAGTITAASGIVINLISLVVLRFNKQENDRLDTLTRELSALDRATIAMQYINHILDPKKKDQAMLDLAKQLYTVSAPEIRKVPRTAR